MSALQHYLIPYLISQVVSIVILISALKNIRVARIMLLVMFLYAGIYNMYIGLVTPDEYLEFAPLAIPLYRQFILGWFNEYNHILIPMIAIGQLIISVLMSLRGLMVRLACIGSIIFLLAISPLGIGSAFPFSLTVSVAAYLVLRSKDLEFIWHNHKIQNSQTKANWTN